MNKSKLLAMLATILLLPSVWFFLNSLGFYFGLANVLQAISVLGEADPRLIAGSISSHIVAQILNFIVLLPGLILSSVVVFKFSITQWWFKKTIGVFALLLLFSLPVLTAVGFYLIWLKRKTGV